jgi:hypothetical protein
MHDSTPPATVAGSDDVTHLAEMVDQLRRLVDRQGEELTRLEREVARLGGGGGDDAGAAPGCGGPGDRRFDRRALLRRAPQVAGVVGAGLLLAEAGAQPAAADPGQPVIIGAENVAGGATTILNGGPLQVVGGEVDGVFAALTVDGPTELIHTPSGGPAIRATAAAPAPAVHAIGRDVNRWDDGVLLPGPALVAEAQAGTAVVARSGTGSAIEAASTSDRSKDDTVAVYHAGTGRALFVQSTHGGNGNGAVTGVHSGTGAAVYALQQSPTAAAYAVVGAAGAKGRGAKFQGGAAAVRLVPAVAPTHPAGGLAGDLFVDAVNRLWYCTRGATGTAAAAWKQLA